MEGIVIGKRYSLSFKNKATDPSLETENAVTSLQYVFKPSSIDVERPGTVTVSDTNEVLISLPTLDGVYRQLHSFLLLILLLLVLQIFSPLLQLSALLRLQL